MEDWEMALGRERCATDQPPGTYRYRSRRGCPWQPLRILWDGYLWHVLLIGKPVVGSGRSDPLDIPFVQWRAPFHPIPFIEYVRLIQDYEMALPGSPLLTPNEPINLREAPPL